MENLKDALNEEQYRAVTKTDGAVLVLAGAGTGKTRVITYRIAHLIKDCDIQAGNILAVTFTNKAASEMKSRLYGLLGGISKAIHIGTFHSICLNILKRDGGRLGLSDSIAVIDQDDRLSLIKQLVKELRIDDKKYPAKKYLNYISEFKNSFDFVNHKVPDNKIDRLSNIFMMYQSELSNQRMIDFDDMLSLVVRLFMMDEEILRHYRDLYRYILVDEYQDTNSIQGSFLGLIGRGGNICVVGDDDQSIYGWRGAEIRNIIDFDKDYEGVDEIKLVGNYRSSQKILDLANELIEKNRDRRGKRLSASKDLEAEIVYNRLYNESAESIYVAERIESLIERGISRSEIAVLYRTNAQSRNFEVSLNRRNIAYKVIGGTSFYQRKEIRDILSYLKIYDNRFDALSFRRSIKTPSRGIGDATIDKIIDNAIGKSINLIESLVEYSFGLSKPKESLNKYLTLFTELDDIKSIKDKINHIVEGIDYRDYLKQFEDHDTANKKIDNVSELYSAAAGYEESVVDISLSDFLASTSLQSSQDDDEDGVVKLMTIHASKGLEFEAVFITGLEEGLFPSSGAIDEGNLEEERRLCYVAITRAMRFLYFTSVAERFSYGKRVSNRESIFLSESGVIGVRGENSSKVFQNPVDSRSNHGYSMGSLSSLKIADKVTHGVFGEGVILSIEGDGDDAKVLVHFKQGGVKRILSSFLKRR